MEHQMVTEGQYLAVFNSTHRVLQAEAILKQKKLHILLMPAPRAVQTDCGLAIRFAGESREEVMVLLKESELLPAFLCQFVAGQYIKTTEYFDENH